MASIVTESKSTLVFLGRAALIHALDRARRVAPSRFPKLILTCVRLEASGGVLRIQATDGDSALYTQLPADGELPACVVPCGELIRRLKAAQHETCSLALSADGEQLRLNGGRVEHSLYTQDVAEFPPVPEQLTKKAITIDAAELVQGLKIAGHAVARESSRYATDGILLESDRKATRLVATDGRRLVIVPLRRAVRLGLSVILHRRFCQLIEKLADRSTDRIAVAVERQSSDKGEPLSGRIYVAGADWLLSTFESEGTFPRYRDVAPESHSKFAVPRMALIETLAEVALTANTENRIVRIALSARQLLLKAEAPGVAQSEAVVPAEFLGGGDEVIHTAFNPAFLLEALKTLEGDAVVIDVGQNGYSRASNVYGKPALLYSHDKPATRWVVMPVNADLPATRASLGSNFPAELEEQA